MKILKILFLALFLFQPSALMAKEGESRLLGGKVTYLAPASWNVIGKDHGENDIRFDSVLFQIPFPNAENTDYANATIIAAIEKTTLEKFSAWIIGRLFPEGLIVDSKTDKDTWRSVLIREKTENGPYVVFLRFGVIKNTRVHLVVAFPAFKDIDEAWLKKTCAEINLVSRNLKILDKNAVESEIIYETGKIGLQDLTTSESPEYGILVNADEYNKENQF